MTLSGGSVKENRGVFIATLHPFLWRGKIGDRCAPLPPELIASQRWQIRRDEVTDDVIVGWCIIDNRSILESKFLEKSLKTSSRNPLLESFEPFSRPRIVPGIVWPNSTRGGCECSSLWYVNTRDECRALTHCHSHKDKFSCTYTVVTAASVSTHVVGTRRRKSTRSMCICFIEHATMGRWL